MPKKKHKKKAAKKRTKKKAAHKAKKKAARKPKHKAKKKAARKPKHKAKKKAARKPKHKAKKKAARKPKHKTKKKTSPKRNAKKRRKPIIERVRQQKSGQWVLEKVFVPKGKFRRDALVEVKTGKKTTFLSTKRRGVHNIFGVLPKDYDPKTGVALRLTIQKRIINISKAKAKTLMAANPQLLIISNPCRGAHVVKGKRPNRCKMPNKRKPKARKKAGKPHVGRPKVKSSLMKVQPRKNLTVSSSDVGRARRAFKRFHFVAPAKVTTGNVPNGYENAYMVIGELERFDVKTPSGEIVSRRYNANRPRLCTTANMKDIFVFAPSRLGIPAGKAMRCDYRVPAHSGRNKWSRRWWHPHDTHPKVLPHRGGRAVRVTGKGLKVTPRGIEG